MQAATVNRVLCRLQRIYVIVTEDGTDHSRAAWVGADMSSRRRDTTGKLKLTYAVVQQHLPRGVSAEVAGYGTVNIIVHERVRQTSCKLSEI